MSKFRARSPSRYLTRRRWTEHEAREALSALEQSGLDGGAFALREGLDAQRLTRWCRRLAAVAASPAFEEVTASVSMAAVDGGAVVLGKRERFAFEVVLPSGCVVRVPESFETSALRRLLSVVKELRAC